MPPRPRSRPLPGPALALLVAAALAPAPALPAPPEATLAPSGPAACDPQGLPSDAGALDRLSMQLVGRLRARERPLVPVGLTNGFVASLGVCDRRRSAAQAARCRIQQMCARLDATDPDARLAPADATGKAAPTLTEAPDRPAPPADTLPDTLEPPARVGVAP